MLVLDTNHFSELERGTERGAILRGRLRASSEEKALAISGIEEGVRGWLAEINRTTDLDRQVYPYTRLQRQLEGLRSWTILGWDVECAAMFRSLRAQGVRIGTMDLKIACICLAHDATLLTRNARDFSQVPGLRFENWLD